jgi:phenylpyruvate tautomerase PptA (4-oxalocrotonate tautomerase family)
MPFVRVDLVEGRSSEYRSRLGEVIYDAMRATLDVPADDRFQVITEHRGGDLVADPTYFGINRTADCVFIQVTLKSGRTVEAKQAFYRAVADGLHDRLGLRREDVFINLVDVAKENWSFGNGAAQLA